MTGTTTGQTALPTATDSDDNDNYLTVSLVAALQALANLFESGTGHAHDGSGKGKPVTTAGIAAGAITPALMNATAAGTFTPTVTQSNSPALTTANGRYLQLGKLVFVWVFIAVNGAGTGANAIVVGNLPVAARSTSDGAAGHGNFQRSGLVYDLEAQFSTSTSVLFWVSAGTGQFGINPAVTLAAGDSLLLSFMYEAA